MPYVFWLAAISLLHLPGEGLSHCRVYQKSIEIHSAWPLQIIPIESIIKCEKYRTYDKGQGTRFFAAITLDKLKAESCGLDQHKFFLAAADPLFRYSSEVETDCLVSVINAFRQKAALTVHPNPYYRAIERKGRLDDFVAVEWDAFVSPEKYSDHPLIASIRESRYTTPLPFLVVLTLPLLIGTIGMTIKGEPDAAIIFFIFTLIMLGIIGSVIRHDRRRAHNIASKTKRE